MFDLLIKLYRYIRAWIKFHWHIFIGFFVCIALVGCAKTTTVAKLSTDAEKSVVETQKALSPECLTPEIKARLEGIKTQIASIYSACENEKKDLIIDKNYWRTLALGLGLILVGLFVLKIKI